MNGIGFQLATPASGSGGKMPETVEKAIDANYAEAQGALLVVDGTDLFQPCGADPILIAAVALTPGGADTSGFNILGRKEFPTKVMQGIRPRNAKFLAPYLGTLGTNGLQYGVTRDTDGVWKVDFNKVDNPRVILLGTPDRSPADAAGSGQDSLVEVSILDAYIQPI